MAVILRHVAEFGSFGAKYVKVVEIRVLEPHCRRQKCAQRIQFSATYNLW